MTAAPTDGELAALVAEHVAGWKPSFTHPGIWWLDGEWATTGDLPPYATSADAVLPLLDRWLRIEQARHPELNLEWYAGSHKFSREPYVELAGMIGGNIRRYTPTIPMAACLALLEAHGMAIY